MSNRKERNGSTVATTYEFNFPQPKEKVPLKYVLYNPKEGTILGRTPGSWSKILIFYIIFYAVLAGLFAICMQALLSTLHNGQPKWKLDSSLIGTNPGLGYRPLANETARGSVIQFKSSDKEEQNYWINLLNDFLEPYLDTRKLPNQGRNQKQCTFDTKLNDGQVCAVDLSNFSDCSPQNSYGYDKSAPCVFLKLNKIFDWEPDYYVDEIDLPEDMPQDLKDHIRLTPRKERKQVWVSCKWQNDIDGELVGQIYYFPPSRGFPSYYYPYRNVEGYLSPLIAVHFSRPRVGHLMSVECRAWAKNIIYSGSLRDRKGSVTFQLLID